MILVGEAFSQEVAAGPDIDRSLSVCRARIEGRIILCDTGEILTINDAEGQAVDLASAVAAKAAIRNAATTFANKLINSLLVQKSGDKAQNNVQLILSGIDFAEKIEFEEVIASLGDAVLGTKDISFREGRAEMEVRSGLSASDLVKKLYIACKKANLNFVVEEQTNRRIAFRNERKAK